ncbi:SMc04008-like domain-containing protein [Strongyloides ratti]|uniref:SMc04008-like domain-containing protein n=1 Tax=Strongyloides ratti TaxID=34506 RepID=A0A090L1B0_STRRB|nr:SMc04008-like domain-containing protein [Strongyloides ratti]CEF63576.2 SMc04008-like domain-containing protein [Strongyloides ratti]
MLGNVIILSIYVVQIKSQREKKISSNEIMPVDNINKLSDNIKTGVKEEVDLPSSKSCISKSNMPKSTLNDVSFEPMTIEEMSNQSGLVKAYNYMKKFHVNKNAEALFFYLTNLAQIQFTSELACCTDLETLLYDISQCKNIYNKDTLKLANFIRQCLTKYTKNDKKSLRSEMESSESQTPTTKKRNKPIIYQGKRRLTGLYGENDNLPPSPVVTKKSKKSDSGSMKVINSLLDQTVSCGPSFGESLNQVKQKKSPIKKRGPQVIDSTSINVKEEVDSNDKDEIVVTKKPNKKGHNIKFVDEVYPNTPIVQIREFELIPNERTHFQPNMVSNNIAIDYNTMNEGTVMRRHLDDEENSTDEVKEVENELPYEISKIDRRYVEGIPLSYEIVNQYIYEILKDTNPVKYPKHALYKETPDYRQYLEHLNTEQSNGLRAFHDKNSITNLHDETIKKVDVGADDIIEYNFDVPVRNNEGIPEEKDKDKALTLVEKLKTIRGPVSGEINSIMAKLREQGVIKAANDALDRSPMKKCPERKPLINNVDDMSSLTPESYLPTNNQRGSWELASVVTPPSVGGGWTSMNSGQLNRENTFSESRAQCTNLHGNEQTVGYKKACGIVINNKKKSYEYDKERHGNIRRNYDNSSRRRISPQPEYRIDNDDKDRNRKRRLDDESRRNPSTKRPNYVSKHRDDDYDVVADRRYLTASHV